jgi:predicted Fe-Mo cluster-binding NifX family protein
MIIAFPISDSQGMESPVYGHFGSAPYFIVVETENGRMETIVNQDAHHEHGGCQPLAALGGHRAEAVVVGGIGAGALRKLQAAGIRVYRAVEGTVRENLGLITSGRLPEFSLNQTCAGHGAGGGCTH